MFQLNLHLELSFVQTIYFHYTPSLLHIPKMMMNAVTTLQPMVEYSTSLLFMLFSIVLLLLFFSTIPFPPLVFIYVHFSILLFPLLFSIVFQWHFLYSCYFELFLLNVLTNLMIVQIPLMTEQILLLIKSIFLTYHLQISTSQIPHFYNYYS